MAREIVKFQTYFRCKVIDLAQAGVFNLVLHNPLQQQQTVPGDYPGLQSFAIAGFIRLIRFH
jgi:hypothetical protein